MSVQSATTPTAAARVDDRRVLVAWGVTRVLVLLAAWLGGSALLSRNGGLDGYLALWDRWETPFYQSIAVSGYAPDGPFEHNAAYFPGLALLIKAGLTVGIPGPLTGMAASLVGSLAACLALSRLTRIVGGVGVYGVLAWTLAPVAVFLVAPWAEAIFAGFAFWSWWKGRQGLWLQAGLLAGGAAVFRVNGLFLGAALVVMFLVSPTRAWRQSWALALPFAVTAAYFAYLWTVTGDPRAWFSAQSEGWDRHLTDPITSLLTTVDLVSSFNDGVGAPHSRFIIEIVAVVGLAAFGVVMLVKRWWAEGFLTLVTVLSLATSTYYYSVPRSAVVLVPVWMLLGWWMSRSRWLRVGYVVVATPLLVLVTMRFAQGQWIS